MDVPYNRFPAELGKILDDIADSHFVAFDLEFSGVAGHRQQRAPGKPSLQELYEETKAAADKYQILQVGLTVVKEDLDHGRYIVKPYNFNISPLPTLRERHFRRDWSMNSGAVQFLLRNRFDFGLPLVNGIPYLSRNEEAQARLTLSEEDNVRQPDMTLKAEDENLIKHIRQSMEAWQNDTKEDKPNYLNIPNEDKGKGVPGALNRYQIRLTHQIIQNEFPGYRTLGMQHFVQVTHPSPAELENIKVLQRQRIDREIGRAIGFRWILEALAGREITGIPDEIILAVLPLSDMVKYGSTFQSFIAGLNKKLTRRRRVLVGHNCFTDLVNLHRFFIGELPQSVEDFQDSIHEMFPAVVDTKHIASFGHGRWGDTSLSAVAEDLEGEEYPIIDIPSGFDRYVSHDSEHEAGFDSLLTANIAIKLSAKFEREKTYLDEDTSESTPSGSQSQSQSQIRSEPFGIKEDGYITASEDLESQSPNIIDPRPKTPPTPLTATRNSFEASTPGESSTEALDTSGSSKGIQRTESESSSSQSTSVLAIKDKKHNPVNWNSTAEVQKVRSAFAAANIYDVLDKEEETSQTTDRGNTDLMSFDDSDAVSATSQTESANKDGKEEKKKHKLSDTDIQKMVEKGQLMPRWDEGNRFWHRFGNKLQVNSCKEGICNL